MRGEIPDRDWAFLKLVWASGDQPEDQRLLAIREVEDVLSVDEIYQATAVISLFNFYNTFVDLNGVAALTPEGYCASGVRLATQGYAPPTSKEPHDP